MSTTMEDAIRRNFAERLGQERGAERPNAIESAQLRPRVRRVSAAPSDLQQARRFQNASVDVRAMERQCVLPAVSDTAALRAFIRVAPDIVKRLDQQRADRTDFRAIGRVIAPWGRRIGDLRFETEGAWKRTGSTVDQLAKELRLALQYPEGAMV